MRLHGDKLESYLECITDARSPLPCSEDTYLSRLKRALGPMFLVIAARESKLRMRLHGETRILSCVHHGRAFAASLFG